MATLDEGVVNLQRFIAHLAASTSALERSGDHFKESAQKFGELEDEVVEEGGGLNDELEEIGSTLDSAKGDAQDALMELIQAASEAQGTTGEAQTRIEEAASDLDEKAQTILGDLDEAHGHLTEQGFDALGQTLDGSQQELETESQEGEQALTELETAVAGFETEAQTAWDAAEGELDEAISDLSEGESSLQTAASEGVQGLETAGTEFEQSCSTLESAVDLIYDVLDKDVAEQGQEWEQHVQTIAKEAIGFVEAGAQERLEQPAIVVEEEAVASLSQEYGALEAVLDGATTTAEELKPLAEELAKCQTIVGQIDELMNALAG